MSWYRAGTVAVTNGGAIVTGTNTDFVSNTQVGEIFVGPDLKVYEVDVVTSATQISIKPPYQSASGAGQTYGIAPTQSFARDLALAFAGFKNTFGGILDTIGQGMFPDGTVAAPGIRFAGDQDTGWRRSAENVLALVAGGVDRLYASTGGIDIPTSSTTAATTSLKVRDASSGSQGGVSITGDMGGNLNHGLWMRMGYSDGLVGATDLVATVAVRSWVAGAERMRVGANGQTTVNTGGGAITLGPLNELASQYRAVSVNGLLGNTTMQGIAAGGGDNSLYIKTTSGGQILFQQGTVENGRFDASGNLLVGVTSADTHVIQRSVAREASNSVVEFRGSDGFPAGAFYSVSGNTLGNGAQAALKLSYSTTTGRSIGAPGTINASGADYAEYVRKSLACGTILKGDVCGIDHDGQLTRTWADARRFVVKSTDPNLVGGDTWAAHLGAKPEAPVYAAPAYDGPAEPVAPVEPAAFVPPVIEMPVQPVRADSEDDEAYLLRLAAFLNDRNATIAQAQAAADAQIEAAKAQVAYAAAVGQYQADLAAYRDAQAAHRTAVEAAEAAHAVALAAHGEALTAWEAKLEAARQTVDRIAFCGQVPVNVDDATLAACEAALGDGVAVYLVAVARGAGIGVTAVRETDMTLQQYMRRLGAVWAIRDGRPWIDVQHG